MYGHSHECGRATVSEIKRPLGQAGEPAGRRVELRSEPVGDCSEHCSQVAVDEVGEPAAALLVDELGTEGKHCIFYFF